MTNVLTPSLLAKAAQARARLGAKLDEINAEIRAYPQPISRCDAQLGGLVEERARIRAELQALEEEDVGYGIGDLVESCPARVAP
jgi:hypothetical protein